MVNHLEGPTLTENDNNREKTEVHIREKDRAPYPNLLCRLFSA